MFRSELRFNYLKIIQTSFQTSVNYSASCLSTPTPLEIQSVVGNRSLSPFFSVPSSSSTVGTVYFLKNINGVFLTSLAHFLESKLKRLVVKLDNLGTKSIPTRKDEDATTKLEATLLGLYNRRRRSRSRCASLAANTMKRDAKSDVLGPETATSWAFRSKTPVDEEGPKKNASAVVVKKRARAIIIIPLDADGGHTLAISGSSSDLKDSSDPLGSASCGVQHSMRVLNALAFLVITDQKIQLISN
ncbi:hypothetical protein CPC08DRAFT_725897 [Agrocybe pediades]|nr:hypothetical protein CPC08DRAFT_725897 [Agrocybe pediades]